MTDRQTDEGDALGVALWLTASSRLEQANARIPKFQRSRESLEVRRSARVGDRRKELLEYHLFVIVDGFGGSAPGLKPIMSIDVLKDPVDDRFPGQQWTKEGPALS